MAIANFLLSPTMVLCRIFDREYPSLLQSSSLMATITPKILSVPPLTIKNLDGVDGPKDGVKL
eukprot:9601920-Ditylum_brightwellii.AAC.1